MAKFLPFVVADSTPIYVYQTIISRSKGMNSLDVVSIFYLVMDKGIKEVRATAEKLPAMALDKVYDALLNTFPTYRIHEESFQLMRSMEPYVTSEPYAEITEELYEYEMPDILNFLLVMCLVGRVSAFTTLRFDTLLEENHLPINLSKISLFSSNGKPAHFGSKEDLKAYVLFNALVHETGSCDPVRAILGMKTDSVQESNNEA